MNFQNFIKFHKDQLVELLVNLSNEIENLENKIRDSVPKSDMSKQKAEMEKLGKAIYRAFPNSRYGSGRDRFCYNRVKTHITAFKSELGSKMKLYKEGKLFDELFDFIIEVAIPTVDDLPDFDEEIHNKPKLTMIKSIETSIKNGIKISKK